MKSHRNSTRTILVNAWLGAVIATSSAIAQQEAESVRPLEQDGPSVAVRPLPGIRPAFGTVVHLGADGPGKLKNAHVAQVQRVPLAPGRDVDLELERFSVTDAASRFVVGTAHGDVELPLPDVALFRGRVRGEPGSQVFLSVHADGANGLIFSGGQEYVLARLSPAKHGVPAGSQLVYARSDTQPFNPPAAFDCEALDAPADGPKDAMAVTASTTTAARVAQVAFECDYEFRQMFPNLTEASNYVAELVGAVSSFYERDINMRLNASYVRIWDTASDPYSATSTSGALTELRNYWNANMGFVVRNTVHMLSGKSGGGGIAYLNQMCGGQYAYGVSSSLNGEFPTPIHDADWGNWDLVVVAHELGHNFRSPHTHCYSPPVDTCYNGDSSCWTGATTCTPGTIMSYCHLCGGMDNLNLTFGPTVSNYIQTGLQACIATVSVSNLVYVDWRNTATENGSLSAPFNTVTEGVSNVAAGGTVSIASGNYSQSVNINQSVTLTATGGTAAIGQ